MAHRHQAEWKSITADRVLKEKNEDRAFQKALMEKLTNTVVEKPAEITPELSAPLYVSDKPVREKKK